MEWGGKKTTQSHVAIENAARHNPHTTNSKMFYREFFFFRFPIKNILFNRQFDFPTCVRSWWEMLYIATVMLALNTNVRMADNPDIVFQFVVRIALGWHVECMWWALDKGAKKGGNTKYNIIWIYCDAKCLHVWAWR